MKNILFLMSCCLFSINSFGQIQESELIDEIFSEWDQPNTPGCALGIIKDGQLIYGKGYGLANMEYDIPNSASSVFRIGSTSKQFTAACIVLLAEREKLGLDNTLKEHFPDFPAYAEKITIRHLLNHTSGIRDYLQIAYLKGLGDDDFYLDENIMEWLVNQSDLNFTPGEEYLYSNSGYWLLGQIVGKFSGMNMAEFAQKEIFEPLGMTDTHFHNDHTQIVKNRASGYVPTRDDGYKISMTTLDMIGDGGIFTTINDIKKWDDAYYDTKVLSTAFWKMMTQQGVLNDGKVINYASGLNIGTYKGLKTIRHGGAFVGFRADLLRFPEQRLSIAIFANRGDANPSRMANQVADIMLKDQLIIDNAESETEDKIAIKAPKEVFSLTQLVGNYEIEAGVALKLSIKNDSLNVLQTWNQSSYNIVKVSGNTFQLPGETNLSFTFSELKKGKTAELIILQAGRKTIAKRKEEVDTSGIKLKDYEGTYQSEELGIRYQFELIDGALNARIEGKKAMKCRIADIDKFAFPLGVARFQRTDGAIVGFELDSGRVKNLKFRKTK